MNEPEPPNVCFARTNPSLPERGVIADESPCHEA